MGPMAVKNCYPMQKLRAQPAQNASADPDGVRPQRSLLIVVNMLFRRFVNLPALGRDTILSDLHLFTGYRSPTGGRLFRADCMSMLNSISTRGRSPLLSPGELDQIKAFVLAVNAVFAWPRFCAKAANAS